MVLKHADDADKQDERGLKMFIVSYSICVNLAHLRYLRAKRLFLLSKQFFQINFQPIKDMHRGFFFAVVNRA